MGGHPALPPTNFMVMPLSPHRDLIQMGITMPGHQKRILCSIQGFKD